MKRGAVWFAVIAIFLIVAILTFKFQSRPASGTPEIASSPSERSTSTSDTTSVLASSSSANDRPIPAMTETSNATPSFATGDAKQRKAGGTDTDLLAVKGMLRDYRAMLGENPIGNNAEISKALLGANSRGAQFSNSQTKLDKEGQLVDRWNHPYFFHQLSKIDMQVRSAGPDGVMWTPDDEVSP